MANTITSNLAVQNSQTVADSSHTTTMITIDDLKDTVNPATKVHWEQDKNVLILVNGIETDETRRKKKDSETVTWRPATLTVVAQIAEDGFWLAPDGGWRGGTMYTKSIVDTKLLFIGVAPDASTHASVFTKDWSLAMTVLDQIQKMAETPHFKDKQGFMMIPSRKKKESRDEDENRDKDKNYDEDENCDEDNTTDAKSENTDDADPWLLQNWPSTTDEGAEALVTLREKRYMILSHCRRTTRAATC
ncbi:hypothetical protein CPB85DRAFT_1249359 [Mucidula mucida]|nr:hypothetical protein CPB85DRAFT_1249359 [Mucidula mucida]